MVIKTSVLPEKNLQVYTGVERLEHSQTSVMGTSASLTMKR